MAEEHTHKNTSEFLQQHQERIFENNKAWVASKVASDPDFFTKLSSGQHPDYL
jgi:carbonic anhydrase